MGYVDHHRLAFQARSWREGAQGYLVVGYAPADQDSQAALWLLVPAKVDLAVLPEGGVARCLGQLVAGRELCLLDEGDVHLLFL